MYICILRIAYQLGMLVEAAGEAASSFVNVAICTVCHMHYVDLLIIPGSKGHSDHLLSAHRHCI